MNNDLISRNALLAEIHKHTRGETVESLVYIGMIINDMPVIKADGNTSDGYHTFNELYDHRAKLFSVIVRNYPDLCWKSKQHHDGTMYDGMFIVGINTPQGQASYHYDIDPYWNMFNCCELERAPVWDGHTPEDAINRIAALDAATVARARWKKTYDLIDGHDGYECSACGYTKYFDHYAEGIVLCKPFCCNCGAIMDAKEG